MLSNDEFDRRLSERSLGKKTSYHIDNKGFGLDQIKNMNSFNMFNNKGSFETHTRPSVAPLMTGKYSANFTAPQAEKVPKPFDFKPVEFSKIGSIRQPKKTGPQGFMQRFYGMPKDKTMVFENFPAEALAAEGVRTPSEFVRMNFRDEVAGDHSTFLDDPRVKNIIEKSYDRPQMENKRPDKIESTRAKIEKEFLGKKVEVKPAFMKMRTGTEFPPNPNDNNDDDDDDDDNDNDNDRKPKSKGRPRKQNLDAEYKKTVKNLERLDREIQAGGGAAVSQKNNEGWREPCK